MKLNATDNSLTVTFGENKITDIKIYIENFTKFGAYKQLYNKEWRVDGNKVCASTDGDGEFCLEFSQSEFGLEVKAFFTAGKEQNILQALRMRVQGRLPIRPKQTIYNDYDHWFLGNRCDLHMNCYTETLSLSKNQHVFSREYVACRAQSNVYGVIGALTYEQYYSTIRLWENGHFELTANMNEHWHTFDSFNISPNQRIMSDKFLIYIGQEDGLNVLGKAIAKEHGVTQLKDVPTGFNAGYYFGEGVTEKIVLEQLEEIKRKELNIKYYILDAGWYDKFGDWNANERFPHGMKYIGDKIVEAGLIPGIWIAPFKFANDSKPRIEHPEWFITDANYAGGKNHFIDFSIEGAKKWLYDLYRKISVEWGFKYIKFDYVIFDLSLGGYKNKEFTALKNYRTALEVMRSAVTEDTVLMSCTAPMSPSVKFCDAARSGHDVYDNFTSLKLTAKQTLKRLHMAQYLILDPDVFQARTIENEDEECMCPSVRTQEENETYATFQSVTGGAIIFSDKLQLMDKKGFNLIKALLPANPKPATPLDLYDADIPSIFRYNNSGEFEMFAIINWTDYEDSYQINLTEQKYGREFFTKKEFDKAEKFTFTLKPHQSMILYFTKDKGAFSKLTHSIMPC